MRLVVAREELRLVGRHVGVRRAVARAALAAEAPLERILHRLARPAVADHLAAQHFREEARAAAGGVALFARRAIAGAHRAAPLGSALAHADTALELAAEAAADLAAEREPRVDRDRLPVRTPAQVLVDAARVDELPWVHPPRRVPGGLEFAERLHQLGAEHHRQEFGARLAVAVLARERAAVLHHQRRRLGDEAAPVRDTFAALQVEVDARVHAAVAEMAVDRGAIAGAVDQAAELAQ